MIILGHWNVMSSRIILLLGLVRTLGADPHQTPLETMADVTNDFGVCVLQMIATPEDNTVFSPYGLMSMALLVYEGATGQTAAQLYSSLHLPWHRDVVRVGFRDLHRYLRSYFSSEGFLKGLVLSKANVSLKPSYVQVLKFYGFQTDTSATQPVLTTVGSLGGKEQDNNEPTTTNIPETTTNRRVTTTFTPRVPTTRKGTTLKPSVRPTMKPVSTTTTRKPPQGSITTTTRKPPQGGSITTTTRKPSQGSVTTTTRRPPQGSITTTTRKPPQGSITTTRNPPQGSITTTSTRKPPTGSITTTTRIPPQGSVTTTTRRPPQGSVTTTTRNPLQGSLTTISSVNTVMLFTQTTEGASKEPETTLPNSYIGGTTKREESATEITDSLQTLSTEETTSDVPKTTREPNSWIPDEATEEMNSFENEMSTTQSDQTPTEINVVPVVDQELQELESMNMVLLKPNQPHEMPTGLPETTFLNDNDVESDLNEIELSTQETDVIDPESSAETSSVSEIATKEVFTDAELTDTMAFSTMFTDTTIPAEEAVILTTPPDDNTMPSTGMSMLEAIILMENDQGQVQDETTEKETTMNAVNKRSTELPEIISTAQNIMEVSNLFTILSGNKSGDEASPSSSIQLGGLPLTNYQHAASVNYSSIDDLIQVSHELETTNPTLNELNFTDQYPEYLTKDTTETITGLPTLEPDIIIFPTLRLPRAAVQGDEEQKKQAPLGNWVGPASGWHPSPSSQWFWTDSGEKLVPVLTYTAYLPYVDLPTLSATAVQLPLDDSRYSLMVLLPKNVRGLQQMLRSLQWNPIRNILNSFKPTPVYAVVPKFTIVKHINLTPALHKGVLDEAVTMATKKYANTTRLFSHYVDTNEWEFTDISGPFFHLIHGLGIRNIFDAYLANLCEMSSEPNLYVRSVEQVITISVQKYYTFHKWFEASESQVEQHFLATHPFAYFVVDLETKVALISGTIVDPQVHNT